MDCRKCQELLSDYLDGTLEPKDQVVLSAHLNDCLSCVGVQDDLSSIVGFCRAHRNEYEPVLNQQALWLRISNVIEGESARASWAHRFASASRQSNRGGWWAGFMNKRWELSLPQMAAMLAAIMIAVSFGTIAGLRLTESSRGSVAAGGEIIGGGSENALRPVVARDYQDLMRRQQVAVDYWHRRVEQRKSRWSPQMREAFDRNLNEVNLSVNDALTGLRQDPHDGVAEEMLDTAMSEKMELLKEFSEL